MVAACSASKRQGVRPEGTLDGAVCAGVCVCGHVAAAFLLVLLLPHKLLAPLYYSEPI
jgi:hypothetical protein